MNYSGNNPNSQSSIEKLRTTVDIASLGTMATGFGLQGLDATNTNPNIRGFSAASKQVVSELGNIGKQSFKTFSKLSKNIQNSESVLESFTRKTSNAEQRIGKLASGINNAVKDTNFSNLDNVGKKATNNVGKSFSSAKLGAKITNQGFDTSNFNTPFRPPNINDFLENPANTISNSAAQSITKPSFPVNRLDDSSIDVITGQGSKLQNQADETAKLVKELTEAKKLANNITISNLNVSATKVETTLGKIGKQLVNISNILDKAQWFTFALGSAEILLNKIGEIKNAFANVEGSLDVANLSGVDTRQTERITGQLGTVGGAASTIIGGFGGSQDIVGIAKEATAEYNRFSQAVAKVDTVFSGSEGIKSFTKNIQELVGNELQNAVSSTEALSGAYEVLSSGFTGAEESLNVLSAGLKLSVASGTESGQVLRLLGKTLNAYGKDASEAAEVAGLLNRAVENGITTIPELSNGFGSTATSAKEAGVAIEDLAAAVGTLTSAGETTPRAFTQIKSFSREIASGDLQRKVDEENITDKDGNRLDVSKEAVEKSSLQEVVVNLRANTTDDKLATILSGRAYQLAINLSSEGGDKAIETLENIKQTSDKVSESLSDALEQNLENVFKIKLETDEILKFEQITNRVSESLIKIGQAVEPAFQSGIDKLEKLSNTVDAVSEKFPGLIKASVDTALAFKAIGISTKAIATGAAQITGLFIATRFLTGAAFGQIGALVDLNKGWRNYNVVTSKVVGQNGKLYNSFQKLGLILSQISGLGAADSIAFSSGATTKAQQLQGLSTTTRATGSVLQTRNINSTIATGSALSSAFVPNSQGQIATVSATPIAQVQGRYNPLSRFNNALTRNRNVPRGAGLGIGTVATSVGNLFSNSGFGGSPPSSRLGGIQNTTGKIGTALNNSSALSRVQGLFSKLGKGLSSVVGAVGSFAVALAPATVALGALASSAMLLDSIILRINEPRKQAKRQNEFLDRLEKGAVDESTKKVIQGLDRGRFGNNKKNLDDNTKESEGIASKISTGLAYASLSKPVGNLVSNARKATFNAFRDYRGNIKGNSDIDSGEFDRRIEGINKIVEKQFKNEIETIENTKKLDNNLKDGENIKARETFIEKESKKLETRKNHIEEFTAEKNKLEDELKRTSPTSTKNTTLKTEINLLKTALSELERGITDTAEKIKQQERAIKVEDTLSTRYEDGNQDENRSFSSRTRAFKTRQEGIQNLLSEVTSSEKGTTEDALSKLDKKTKDQINSILKQSNSGQISTEEALSKLDNLKNQQGENGKTLGETVSAEVELLFSDIGIEAIKNKVEKLKNDLESEQTTLRFQVDSGLINKAEFQAQIADSKQESIKERIEVNRRQQELAKGRPEELRQLKNTEQELLSQQQSVRLQQKNAPLNIQQQFLQTQQQSELTASDFNNQNIRAIDLQKLENTKEQQEKLRQKLTGNRQKLIDEREPLLSEYNNSIKKRNELIESGASEETIREFDKENLEQQREKILKLNSKIEKPTKKIESLDRSIQTSDIKIAQKRFENEQARLTEQQDVLNAQQNSELTRNTFNNQSIGKLELQKLQNRQSSQQELKQQLIDRNAPEESIFSIDKAIQKTNTQIAQQRFDNQNNLLNTRQSQLQQQASSSAVQNSSIQPELRQLEIQKVENRIKDKRNLLTDLENNPNTPNEQVFNLQKSLTNDNNQLQRLKREDAFEAEKLSSRTEIEKINTERSGFNLQQKGLEATSSTASAGLNALGELSSIISNLDIDDNTKKELQQEALDKQLELSNRKFEIEKKILGLEEKKLVLAQRQAELEAKTKVSEAKANLKETEANKEQVLADPNATDKQKEAANARVTAAENRVDTAKQNVKLTQAEGAIEKAINKGQQSETNIRQTNEELSIKARKADFTETNQDDYEVFEEAGKAIANTSKTVATNLDILNTAITKTSESLGISPVVGNKNNEEKTKSTLRAYEGEGSEFIKKYSENTSEIENEKIKSVRKSQKESRDFEDNQLIKEIDNLRSRVNEFTAKPYSQDNQKTQNTSQTQNNSETQQKQAPNLNIDFSMPVTIQGNADNETIDDLKSQFESLINSKFDEVAEQLNSNF